MKLTITRRSKVGFSWTNQPERRRNPNGSDYLAIADPADGPTVTGSVLRILDAYQVVARKNSANEWRARWFLRHEGQWVEVRVEISDIWMLYQGDREGPITNSVEVHEVRHQAEAVR